MNITIALMCGWGMPITAYFCCKFIFYKYTKPSQLDAAGRQMIKALMFKIMLNAFFVVLYLRLASQFGLSIDWFVLNYIVALFVLTLMPFIIDSKASSD